MSTNCGMRYRVPQLLSLFAAIALTQIYAPTVIAQETVLYSFVGTTGNVPQSGVILDKNGNLYGTTPIGGNLAICDGNGCGLVFEIVHKSDGTWSERNIYSFTGGPSDGASPYSTLVFDSHGHLFGMTYYGGTGSCSIGQFPGCGTIFELVHTPGGGWTESVIYNFQGGNDGAYPQANLILDARGNLYGTTSVGGGSTACLLSNTPYGCGTVFQLSPNADGTWSESVLYRFQGGLDGAEPFGGVIFDGLGSLYGTTGGGGFPCEQYLNGSNCGTVYKLRQTSTGWVKSTPYRFKGGTDGFSPEGSLILDASGNLYGTTYFGGITSPKFGNGVVFELSPAVGNTWTENVIYRFTGFLDGGYPTAGVVFDTHGNLFALPFGGGSNGQDAGGGTVDELTPSASGEWTETTIFAFPGGAGGELPIGGLAIDADGNLYGTAAFGGASSAHCPSGCGVVFEATP